MFCSKCGAFVEDGAAFCSSCGVSVGQSVQPVSNVDTIGYQAQKNSIRNSELAELDRTIAYFAQKKNQFDEYDEVCEKVNYYAQGAKSALIVWGAIISTFSIIILLANAGMSISGLMAIMLITLFPGLIMIAGGILMKIFNARNRNIYQERYNSLSEELYDHYIRFPNCPVGVEYVNPEVLVLIKDVLQSGRADTIKESINLLIAEQNQAELQQYLQQIETNTASANANARAAAFFAAASFFR